MQPEQWQRVKEILEAALERSPGERAAFLDAEAGEGGFRSEVESLLAAHEKAGDFLESPPGRDAAEVLVEDREDGDDFEGEVLGAYRILREIGRGGMGAVYLAVRADGTYDKQVAIKVVKRGMDTDEVLRRFWQECRTLAGLDHPNIARLLDAGTTGDGRPFFVMEHVDGSPIDAYSDARGLTIQERLRLFRTVCAAVHSAHQNLVVHRDIKPANVLVTADGEPRLLDFGIAKVLEPAGGLRTMELTGGRARLLTPEYASPEQLRGDPITTATDVYLLGLLLYELLTGCRPRAGADQRSEGAGSASFEGEPAKPSTAVRRTRRPPPADGASGAATPGAAERTGPPEPEKLRRRLQGDLDKIVLMALRNEPARRYASVEQLSEDLRRHLEGLPVLAREPTLRYRATKFIRRNKAGVLAGALVAAVLLAGLLATVWQAQIAQVQRTRAEAERARAERRFADVRKLANSYLFEFHDAIAELPGSTAARGLVAKRALEYLDALAKEAAGDRSLQAELATAYAKVGAVYWNRYYANLGNTEAALESQRKALAIRKALATADPVSAELRVDLARSWRAIGDLEVARGRLPAALASYRTSLAVLQELQAGRPRDPDLRTELAIAHQRIGDNSGNPRFANLGDTTGALAHYRAMQVIFEELSAADLADAHRLHSVSIGHEKLGDVLDGMADTAGALERYRRALVIRRTLAKREPANARYRRDLAVGFGKVGDLHAASGAADSALANYGEMLRIRRDLSAADPSDARARRDLAGSHLALADVWAARGDAARAARHYRAALQLSEELALADPRDVEVRSDLARAREGVARSR